MPKRIAVIHLDALPGAPKASGFPPWDRLRQVGNRAVDEARRLEKLGFDGLILENFGDVPFFKERVGPETIAAMSVLATAVRESTKVKVGINILRNDAFSALAVASVTGCDFIRANVLSGLAAGDQGLLEGKAAELMREKERLGSDVLVLADAHVKHAQTLSQPSLEMAVEELIQRAGCDGVVISGEGSGRPPLLESLRLAQSRAKTLNVPVYVGSGADSNNLPELKQVTPYFIVSSALRKGGQAGAPLDIRRATQWISAYKKKGKVVKKSSTSKKKRKKK